MTRTTYLLRNVARIVVMQPTCSSCRIHFLNKRVEELLPSRILREIYTCGGITLCNVGICAGVEVSTFEIRRN